MNGDRYIYGIHAVKSLLQTKPQQVGELLFARGRSDKRMQELIHLAQAVDVPVRELKRVDIKQMFPDDQSQGVVAVLVSPIQSSYGKDLFLFLDSVSEPVKLLVLDGVQDPHNLGACLRTCDAAGVHAVVVPKDRAVGLTTAVRKVACGAAERVPFFTVTNLARTLQQLQERGIWIYGAVGEASRSLFAMDLNRPLAMVLGAEEKGLRRLTREYCDELFSIPMLGEVDSLNVSVATGVCLYEVVRQQQQQI